MSASGTLPHLTRELGARRSPRVIPGKAEILKAEYGFRLSPELRKGIKTTNEAN
jgi:hypothetical protein